MKKITVLLGTTTLILALLDQFNVISKKYCSITCLQNFDGLGFNWFLLLSIAFILSFLLNLYSQQLHYKWWKFARVAIPVIFIISTVINMGFHRNNYGPFNMDNMFDLPALIILYVIFVLGSLIQIVRGYQNQ